MLGQILLARRMGKKRIIAETGAGQHGVATATLCARFGLECVVYMGAVDVARQKPNVFRMKMLGAEVVPVQSGTRTLKDAMNEALRDWVTNVAQHLLLHRHGRRPASLSDAWCATSSPSSATRRASRCRRPKAACRIRWSPASAAAPTRWACSIPSSTIPRSRSTASKRPATGSTQLHAASIAGGRPGVLHGNRTYLLMNEDGQIQDAHSISAGLDYPGIGPEHSWLHDIGRVTYLSATDDEALDAFQLLSRLEGIIPALEPAHALAQGDASSRPAAREGSPHGRSTCAAAATRTCLHGRPSILGGEEEAMTRIDRASPQLAARRPRRARHLLMAGDPDPETSLAILKALPKAGADVIEIGMPFTDPMADGPAIQAAGLRALKAGQTCRRRWTWCAASARAIDATPIVLMGYYNPIYIYGVDRSSPTPRRPASTA